MTKRDIVRSIAEEIKLSQFQTRVLVQRTFEALVEALVRDGRVELRNFGIFQIKQRDARLARNPRTGEPVSVEAKNVVTFKPGKEMEARVREFKGATPDLSASPALSGEVDPAGQPGSPATPDGV